MHSRRAEGAFYEAQGAAGILPAEEPEFVKEVADDKEALKSRLHAWEK
jgi:hypothetical protein